MVTLTGPGRGGGGGGGGGGGVGGAGLMTNVALAKSFGVCTSTTSLPTGYDPMGRLKQS